MSTPQLVGDVVMRLNKMLEIDTNFPAYRIKDHYPQLASSNTTPPSNSEIVNSMSTSLNRARPRDLYGLKSLNEETQRDPNAWKFTAKDALSREIEADPILMLAVNKWKMLPKTLYNECYRLGLDRVRATVMEVRRMRGIDSFGAKLRVELRKLT